jgi:membrane-associated phospholipid phosphatase
MEKNGSLTPMLIRTAKLFSILGHPLLTIPLLVGLTVFHRLGHALWIVALLVGLVILPISVHMYRSTKKGAYTNFDVSDRRQRKSWYLIVILLVVLLLGVLYLMQAPLPVQRGSQIMAGLLLAALLANRFLKVSLHVALNVFLLFLLLPFGSTVALSFCAFIIAVSWSRIVLGRHTLAEVVAGILLGSVFGWWLYYSLY